MRSTGRCGLRHPLVVAALAITVAAAASAGEEEDRILALAVAILGWQINSFAPLVSAIAWLKYLTLFYYYAGRDPLTRGVDIAGIIALGFVTLLLLARAVIGFERRDLRA